MPPAVRRGLVGHRRLLQRLGFPCGETQSAVSTIAQDMASDANVKTPVLLVYGTKVALFSDPRDSGNKQKAQFTGSPDVTLSFIEGAGNALALERSAPRFRALLGDWLARRVLRARASCG